MWLTYKISRKFLKTLNDYKIKRFKNKFESELNIFTHLNFNEKLQLYNHAKQLRRNSTCVEIGSFLGASSCFIAAGIASKSRIYCIDTWGNHAMAYSEEDRFDNNLVEKDTYEEFKKNTKKYAEKIMILRGWSTKVINEFVKEKKNIDLLFIDGDHNYEGVKKDWDLYGKLLRKGGMVAFHDTGWAEGVIKLINEEVKYVGVLVLKLPNLEIYKIG